MPLPSPRPPPPEIRTLEELLETPGLREDVLDFLPAHAVGLLSSTSRRVRKTVTAEGGKLRAVNYACAFPCRVRKAGAGHAEDRDTLVADMIDFGPVYARLDVGRLKRVEIRFTLPPTDELKRLHLEDDEDPDNEVVDPTRPHRASIILDLSLDGILAPAQSLMGPELIDFSLGCLPGNTTRYEKMHSAHVRCCADKGRLTSFATSLARIHTLEELKIPASLALHEIYRYTTIGAATRGASSSTFPRLRRLHLYGTLRLQDMRRESLAYRYFVASGAAEVNGQDDAPAHEMISARPDHDRVREPHLQRNAVHHFCCALHRGALRLLGDESSPGRQFWRALVTPSLTRMGVAVRSALAPNYTSVDPYLDNEALWQQDWVWEGAHGVTKLALEYFPPPTYQCRLPRLATLLLNRGEAEDSDYPNVSMVHRRRVQLQEFAEAFADNCKWIGFHGFALSLMEVGFLLGRLADDRFWAKGPPELRRALCAKLQEPPGLEEEMSITTVPTTALFIDDW